MVRSVHSRPVAISVGRTSATRSVRRSAAAGSARPASWRGAAITRAAVGAIAFRGGGALSVFLVALSAHYHPTAADHRAVDPRDYAGRIAFGDLDQRMALPQVDLSDAITGNSTLSRDSAHQIADLHTIPRVAAED
jgi:hypothetical protein